MSAFKRLGRKFKDLSPAVVREIIAVIVILCLSAGISMPQFFKDSKLAAAQKAMLLKEICFESASPQDQGMDPTQYEEALRNLKNTSILSLLIIRNGKIVYQKFYGANGRNNIYSVSKSIMSALIGIAIHEGFVQSVDDPVETYLPDCFINISDERWRKITIRHLLTMTPGFCESSDGWMSSEDWIKTILSFPLKYEPGEKFQYANSASHLLSVILTKASGMNTKDFANKYLFEPLGIVSPQWTSDPGGYYLGFSNIYLSTNDLAKFGWLYCSMGKWEGVQLVPEEWVRESTTVRYDFKKERNKEYEIGYGYKWWIDGRHGYHVYSARGFGGQSVSVVPDLGLEVVITSSPGDLCVNDEVRENLLGNLIKSCKD